MRASTVFFAAPFTLALMLGPIFSACTSARAEATRPNIILVLPDDVGVGDYACLGNPVIHTPSVDAFAKEGVRFTQFHVSPTCSPCRSALMSGRRSSERNFPIMRARTA